MVSIVSTCTFCRCSCCSCSFAECGRRAVSQSHSWSRNAIPCWYCDLLTAKMTSQWYFLVLFREDVRAHTLRRSSVCRRNVSEISGAASELKAVYQQWSFFWGKAFSNLPPPCERGWGRLILLSYIWRCCSQASFFFKESECSGGSRVPHGRISVGSFFRGAILVQTMNQKPLFNQI